MDRRGDSGSSASPLSKMKTTNEKLIPTIPLSFEQTIAAALETPPERKPKKKPKGKARKPKW